MKKIVSLLIIISLLSTLLLTGCAKPEENTGAPSNEENSFTFVLGYEITQLDPQEVAGSWDCLMVLNTHDPLVRLNPDGEIVPALAERWEVSEDGLEYTFYLRDNVKFQDGTPLKASDVKFSLERGMTKAPSKRFTEPFDSVEVVSDNVVKLIFKYPTAAALKYVTQGNNAIVSEKIMNEVGEEAYKKNPCGTGPFKLEKWIPGDRLILSANKDYYLGAPKIDTLVVRTITEKTTAMVALETGEVDAVLEIPAISKQSILDNPNLEYKETSGTAYWHIAFNNELPPFDNKLVRKAINMAIDRQEIIDVAMDGQGIPADISIHRNSAGFTDEVKRDEYNPEKAKELLKEAGYPNGFDTQIYVREDFTQKIGQVVQQQLSKIGIKLEVVVMERSALIADSDAGKLGMATFGSNDLFLDAALPLNALDSAYRGKGSNFCFFSNEEYDRLNKLQIVERDPEKREEIIKQMLLIEKEEVPRAPLFFPITSIAYNKEFKGIEVYGTGMYFLYDVYK